MQAIKILQICNKPPFPALDGGAIGMNNVSNELFEAGFEVKILAINTPKHFVKPENLTEEYRKKFAIEFAFINTNSNIFSLIGSLFSNNSYNIKRFNSINVHQKIIEILKQNTFDVIQIESIFLHNYVETIRKYSKAKIILRAPNIEHIIWERRILQTKNFLSKLFLIKLAKNLKTEEINSFKKFDGIYTVTNKDENYIKSTGFGGFTAFIPTGLDVTKNLITNETQPNSNSIFFIGALDWSPNTEGLFWFVKHVLPKIINKIPEIKFHIAGRRPSKSIFKLNSNSIMVHGEIENAQAFIQSNGIMVVPLLSGSGMRVKIIEGMMMSKAIITTTIGIEGIEHKDGKNILIADNADLFAKKLIQILHSNEERMAIEKAAFDNAIEHYSEKQITEKLKSFVQMHKS